MVVGGAGAYAGATVRTLTAQGADIARQDLGATPDLHPLGKTEIVVICPPQWTETPGPLDSSVAEAFTATIARAALWTSAAAAVMAPGSVIVHITGLSGLGGWRGWHAAGAAFAGIHNLVRSFAVELAPRGVRVNALVPGISLAQGEVIAREIEQPLDAVRARIPVGEFMSEEAFGNSLIYLVHPSSSYVTGEILAVDGGWDIWGRLHAVAT